MLGIETADMVRAETPAALSAVSRASEFMTVPSMPMASAVGRSIQPAALIRAPRMMLPPPITSAISKPASVASPISRARPERVCGSSQ
jgi:hypothetical protein